MKVKLAIAAVVLLFGGCAVKKVIEFKSSPTGQVIEQLQERKQLIEQVTKSPQLTIPLSK
tara:strand:+ start:19 stop:198 length:180 start_codon:yes stop_codon:yes gene_type:complete